MMKTEKHGESQELLKSTFDDEDGLSDGEKELEWSFQKKVLFTSDDEDGLSDGERDFTWSLQKKFLLLSLCFVHTIQYGTVYLIAPFFPNVARDKGVSSSVIGIIFASYSLVAGIFSPVCTLLIVKLGPRLVIMVGFFVAGTCQALFGLCNMLRDSTSFVITCLTLRVVNALGGAACATAVYFVGASEFPGRTSIMMGILECCIGIGSFLSPAAGGILYTVGGFPLPFIVTSSLMFALLPLIYLTLSNEGSDTPSSLRTFYCFIRIPSVLVVAISILAGSIFALFLEPIFSLHSEKVFGMNAAENGLVFLLYSVMYTIGVALVGWISEKTRCYRLIIVTGFLGLALGYFLIGPTPFLDFILPARSLALVIVAFSIIGFFFGMIFVPAIPDMLQSAKRYGMEHNKTSVSAAAGVFNSMACFGGVISPVLAGYLYQEMGFSWATSVVAIFAGFQALFVTISTQCERRLC